MTVLPAASQAAMTP